jgi:hypothetical protein
LIANAKICASGTVTEPVVDYTRSYFGDASTMSTIDGVARLHAIIFSAFTSAMKGTGIRWIASLPDAVTGIDFIGSVGTIKKQYASYQ